MWAKEWERPDPNKAPQYKRRVDEAFNNFEEMFLKEIDLEALPKPKSSLEARLKTRREVNA